MGPQRHKDTKLHQVIVRSMLSALCSFVPSCLGGDYSSSRQPALPRQQQLPSGILIACSMLAFG